MTLTTYNQEPFKQFFKKSNNYVKQLENSFVVCNDGVNEDDFDDDIIMTRSRTGVNKTLYCVCRQVYDPRDGEMVKCTRCKKWYHWKCVGYEGQENDLNEFSQHGNDYDSDEEYNLFHVRLLFFQSPENLKPIMKRVVGWLCLVLCQL